MTDCPYVPWMINFHSTQDGTILNQQYKSAMAANYIDHLCQLNLDSELPRKRLSGIICSVAPGITPEMLEEMMSAGMNMAVIKLAHCTQNQAKDMIQMIKKTIMNYSIKIGRVYPLAIAIDIKGPEIRVGRIKDKSSSEIQLVEGETTKVTNDPMYEEFVTKEMIYVSLKDISDVVPGDKIHISNTNNGQIRLSALKIVGSVINCIIENTGKFSDRASVSLEATITIPLLQDEDREAIQFCSNERVTIIFVPYAEQAAILKEIRGLLGKQSKSTLIIAKIENTAGVYNVDKLLEVADGILISRVALASELSHEKVVIVQKMITGKCSKLGIPSILAPSVLQSMTTNSVPNNSEISDITGAIVDGVDCFMLSRETTVGSYPIETIKTLDAICRSGEPLMYQLQIFQNLTKTTQPVEPLYAVSIAAVEASMKCNAAAIIVATVTGRSAKLLARFRPRCPIIAVTRYAHVSRLLNMWRGIDPVHYIKKAEKQWCKDIEKRVQFGLTHGKRSGYVRTGDALVVVMGSKMGTGFTNALKIVYASEFDTMG